MILGFYLRCVIIDSFIKLWKYDWVSIEIMIYILVEDFVL